MNIRGAITRIVDIYRHPGEFPVQRQRRRYLEGLDHATPAGDYALTSAKLVDSPSPGEIDLGEGTVHYFREGWIEAGKKRDEAIRREIAEGKR